jgi:hypothetical protein
MPDITPSVLTIKANQLAALDTALAGVFPLSPPPAPRGRYALAKAAKIIGAARQTFNEQHVALLTVHAVKDDAGQPVPRDGTPEGSFSPKIADMDAFTKAFAELGDEVIELTGCRMISHAELGDCPITVQQETALLGVLLTDEEPA